MLYKCKYRFFFLLFFLRMTEKLLDSVTETRVLVLFDISLLYMWCWMLCGAEGIRRPWSEGSWFSYRKYTFAPYSYSHPIATGRKRNPSQSPKPKCVTIFPPDNQFLCIYFSTPPFIVKSSPWGFVFLIIKGSIKKALYKYIVKSL